MFRRVALLLFTLAVCFTSHAELGYGTNGIVASVNDIATRAGVDAMRHGGNAVDAAVATGLTLGVVDGFNSGIGGGCFILIRQSNGKFLAIDGREMAPAAATRDMFIRNGKGDTELSQTGPLASGVPGALAAYDLALRKAGRLSLRYHLMMAAQIAEEGFRLDKSYAKVLEQSSTNGLTKFNGSRALFWKPDGTIYKRGDLFRQPDLANTYRMVAQHGLKWFYGGPFAKSTESWMKRNGGIMTAHDFAHYKAVLREPIATDYRGYEIVSFPPPSSGGVHLLEMLNILETRDLKSMSFQSVDSLHLIAETMKLAFADRAYWLGDPDFAKVPRGLVDKKYAHQLAAKINMQQIIQVQHGTPDDADENVFKKHTTHLSTADRDGNWVALTQTVNTSFGSKVVIPGTGVIMNNEMDDFSVQPGVTNFFGLVGNEANSVAPGKRPLSSMTPTIVLKDKQPILAVGAAGGPTIISQTLLNIVNVLDYGLPLDKAIDAPRIHQQWSPDEVRTEKSLSTIAIDGLEERGHKIKLVNSFGVSQAVMRSADGKTFVGAADSRAGGTARGW